VDPDSESNSDSDPGGQKLPTKIEISCFEVLDVTPEGFFCIFWTSFMGA
jgi:hypothetical protein